MRIALIRQRYNPYGGAERFVSRALEALAAQGADVTLFARKWEGTPGVRVERVAPFYLGRLWRDRSFAHAVCRAVGGGRFDLVQSHERLACCDIYRAGDGVHAQWLELRGRAQTGSARRATALDAYHRYVLAAEREMFASPRLKTVICNSQMIRTEIARRFGLPDARLTVIYNGVDLELFHPRLRAQHRASLRARLGVDDAACVYLFVGSGFARKGVPALLDAFARLDDKAARLWIVGRDKDEGAMLAQAERLGIAARVRFAGGQSDVTPWYGAADCFVLPTLYDPFPNAALEALACALPIIVSDTCGAAELVRPGENGYVCDALDVPALAARMAAIAASPAERLGPAARASAEPFGLAAMAERLIALYRELLEI
jgi:UDP-glucose:(heptosyl)LPS alpha-1,3-glucosyltransferase